ncbi:MAG: sulfite exporter TauE/SafE family protein [Aureliella sp.]
MLPLVATVFVASLFGSLHCVGMCGPLAVLASSGGRGNRKVSLRSQLGTAAAYHGSRVAAYAAAGCMAGLLGASIQHTGILFGVQRLAAQLAGGSMLVIGLLGLVRLAGGSGHAAMLPQWLQRRLGQAHSGARRQPPMRRAAAIGLLTAILPCGWLYAFLIVAAGTAEPLTAALVMATFALGAVPALAATALSLSMLAGRFRHAIPWCSAVLITVVGMATLLQRSQIELKAMNPTSNVNETSALASQIEAIDHKELPCCSRAKPPDSSSLPIAPLRGEGAGG